MITLLCKATIQPDKTSAFEAAFGEIAAKAKESEPDTLVYKLTRSQSVPNEYHIVEFYRSAEALAFHMDNPATKPLMGGMGQYFAGAPEVNILDDVVQG